MVAVKLIDVLKNGPSMADVHVPAPGQAGSQPRPRKARRGKRSALEKGAGYNPYRAGDGRFASGNGAGGGAKADPIKHLASGKVTKVTSRRVPGMFARMARSEGHPDITLLEVQGTRMFAKGGLGIARIDMPQLPKERKQEFLDTLDAKVTTKRVDPMTLQPSQKEISGSRSGRIFEAFRQAGGIKDTNVTVSNEGHVIDGHHTWAAAVAYGFARPGARLTVTHVDMPTKALLKAALKWNKKVGIAGQSMTAARLKKVLKALWLWRSGHEAR